MRRKMKPMYGMWIVLVGGIDEVDGMLHWCKWKWGIDILKNRPCVTYWLYDWFVFLGPITIFKRSEKGRVAHETD